MSQHPPTPTSVPAPPPAAAGERGSAYIIALLVLLVLSIVGLTISLVTQTEMQVGLNERVSQRVFYDTDAAVSTAIARSLVEADYSAQLLKVPDGLFGLHQEIEVTPFYPILNAPCNLCEINNAGHYGSKQYSKITHGVTVFGRRMGNDPNNVLARKTVSSMVDVEPLEATVEAFLPADDPTQLAKLKF